MQNVSQFITLYGTAKTQLATVLGTIATLQSQLATLENELQAMGAVDGPSSGYVAGNDILEWFRVQVYQAGMAYRSAIGTDAPPAPAPRLIAGCFVYANNPNLPRQTALLDQRPVSQTTTGQQLGLT